MLATENDPTLRWDLWDRARWIALKRMGRRLRRSSLAEDLASEAALLMVTQGWNVKWRITDVLRQWYGRDRQSGKVRRPIFQPLQFSGPEMWDNHFMNPEAACALKEHVEGKPLNPCRNRPEGFAAQDIDSLYLGRSTRRKRAQPDPPHWGQDGKPRKGVHRNDRAKLKGAWWMQRPEVPGYKVAAGAAEFFRRWGIVWLVLLASAAHAQSIPEMFREPPPPGWCETTVVDGTQDFTTQQRYLCYCGSTDSASWIDAAGRERCSKYASIGAMWCSAILALPDGRCAFEVDTPPSQRPEPPTLLEVL